MRWSLEQYEGGESAVRWLTTEERQELRSDMAGASAWARAAEAQSCKKVAKILRAV